MDILGIGECMIELDADGDLAQAESYSRQVGGDVFNTLAAASRLGCKTGFMSKIVDDAFGRVLEQAFSDYNIDTRYVQRLTNGNVTNGLYFSALKADGDHEFLYYRNNSAATRLQPEEITAPIISQAKIVYATGVTQAISSSCRKAVLRAFELAKKHNVIVAYDPNYRPKLWANRNDAINAVTEVLPYVDVLLPTMGDISQLFGHLDENNALEYFRLKGVQLVVLKKGNQGATMMFKQQVKKLPSQPTHHIKDTVGAGDAFNGGFLLGLILGESLENCGRIANIVAAKSLSQRGPLAGLPSWRQVEESLVTV